MPSILTKQGMSAQEMAVQEQQQTTSLLAPVGEQLYRLPATRFAFCKQGGQRNTHTT